MEPAQQQQPKKNPTDFLRQIKNKPVIVKLNDGVTEYRGIFICLDGHLNIVLERCEEWLNGKPTNNKFGDLFIRGNNVQFIAPQSANPNSVQGQQEKTQASLVEAQ